MTNGTGRGLDPLELRHTPADPAVGHQHPAHQPPPLADDRGGPRRRGAGRRHRPDPHDHRRGPADEFIQPLPGTDIALMLAMMHVLIRDGLVERRVDRRAHARVRRARRPRRRLDAGAGRARSAASTPTSIERARHRLRHDPPGRDPHADRRRAPRERGDVLPHARLPAGARRRLGATAAAASPAASARTATRSIDDAALTRPDLLAGAVPARGRST